MAGIGCSFDSSSNSYFSVLCKCQLLIIENKNRTEQNIAMVKKKSKLVHNSIFEYKIGFFLFTYFFFILFFTAILVAIVATAHIRRGWLWWGHVCYGGVVGSGSSGSSSV